MDIYCPDIPKGIPKIQFIIANKKSIQCYYKTNAIFLCKEFFFKVVKPIYRTI